MTDDPRELLGRAFSEEPPLRIDRDEVIRQGRKRLRRRRFFEAGSVVAAVLVAVIGAATLTNLSGTEPERLPPAASRTQPPPQTSPLPTTSEPRPDPSTETRPVSVPLDATQLLKLLYEPGIVTEDDVKAVLGRSGRPTFELSGGEYTYEADIIRPKTPGSLHVVVAQASGEVLDCKVSQPYSGCELTSWDGVPVALARYENGSGQRGTSASVVLNGIRVVATTTNLTSYDARSTPSGRDPALTDDELCAVAVKVGQGAA
jgi:hypothetical protein